MFKLYCGDCLKVLKTMQDESMDAIVTDPPYGLGFMGKEWDTFDKIQFGIAGDEGENDLKVKKNFKILPRYSTDGFYDFTKNWVTECLRILKSGGYLLAFGGTRTYHRMACAIEDAGFEIRDMIEWVYGSGFPKSLNIGKKIDQFKGNERINIGKYQFPDGYQRTIPTMANKKTATPRMFGTSKQRKLDKSTSEWEGWGTNLKPAHEPICMARKPLSEKTVAENVLKHGTGGINIDGCRVGTEGGTRKYGEPSYKPSNTLMGELYGNLNGSGFKPINAGRFPANLILSYPENEYDKNGNLLPNPEKNEVVSLFPNTKSGKMKQHIKGGTFNIFSKQYPRDVETIGDSGSAARFFYCAKASKNERDAGCEGLEENATLYNQTGLKNNRDGTKRSIGGIKNNHPTVKPLALMQYLIKLISRENSLILDPFMGSGTTGVACMGLGRNFIGIEISSEYYTIAERRIKAAASQIRMF